jgi:hypothetical protein
MLVATSEFAANAHPETLKNSPAPTNEEKPLATLLLSHDLVHLIEKKVYAHLGEEEDGRSTAR